MRESSRHELRAVASRDLAKGQAYAREWDIPVVYGSYEALLADPEIDAIYNPLPNSLHAEWTIAAVRAGKHVLCEKPMANTPAECQQMIDACGQANRTLMIAYRLRYEPFNRALTKIWLGDKPVQADLKKAMLGG